MENNKKKLGRPSMYTEELGQRICKVVSTHTYGLNRLTAMFDWMPTKETINEWRLSNSAFSAQYIKAKVMQSELLAEDCLDISDESGFDAHINEQGKVVCDSEAINRARLRIDTRKWLAAKLLPKIYGDKSEEIKEDSAQLRKEMQELREQLNAKNKKEY